MAERCPWLVGGGKLPWAADCSSFLTSAAYLLWRCFNFSSSNQRPCIMRQDQTVSPPEEGGLRSVPVYGLRCKWLPSLFPGSFLKQSKLLFNVESADVHQHFCLLWHANMLEQTLYFRTIRVKSKHSRVQLIIISAVYWLRPSKLLIVLLKRKVPTLFLSVPGGVYCQQFTSGCEQGQN